MHLRQVCLTVLAFFSTRRALLQQPVLPPLLLCVNCVVPPLLRESINETDPSWFSRLINQRNRSMMGPIYMPIISGHDDEGFVDILYRTWMLEKYSRFPPHHLFFLSRTHEA